MITGTVTPDREATIRLAVADSDKRLHEVEAVIDTGFNGFLTLPTDTVSALKLPLVGNRRATLGDGSTVVLDLYLATLAWNQQEREVLVMQAEGGPLVGMSLLYGYRVILDVGDGGAVIIDALP